MRLKGTSPKLVFAGHVDGHVNILARTSSDGTWILRIDANTCSAMCAHEDKEVAEENIRKIRMLLEVPRVQVLIANDI